MRDQASDWGGRGLQRGSGLTDVISIAMKEGDARVETHWAKGEPIRSE